MRLILCLSENNGLAFNHRRQSRDAVMLADMAELVGGNILYILPYSEKLISGVQGLAYQSAANAMKTARRKDYVFLEGDVPDGYEDAIDEVILYLWNTDYPADLFFRMDMSPYRLASEKNFSGSSHAEITRQIWERQ